ncbi:MAG: TetR/AcrR family transcriptional regulator [Opitutaceae bacterium]|nr:TetR/AcrR family transcriptional regulator [Opitutaceae bacterium]
MSKAQEKPSSAKRDHLVDTALELFTEGGYHAVGIDAVLARAGVAKMTLYNHFPSKEDLIVAALARKAEQSAQGLEKALAAAGAEPRAKLLAIFDWLEVWFRSKEFRGCIYIKAASEYPRKKDKPHQAALAFKETRLELLRGLCRQAGVKDAETLAWQLSLLAEGAIVVAFMHARPEAARDAKAAAATLLAKAKN